MLDEVVCQNIAFGIRDFELLRKSYVSGVTEDEKVALGEQRMALAEKEKEEKIHFIKENPSSYAAMYLLSGMRNDFTLKDYAATLQLSIKPCGKCLWVRRCKDSLTLPCVQK